MARFEFESLEQACLKFFLEAVDFDFVGDNLNLLGVGADTIDLEEGVVDCCLGLGHPKQAN